MLDLVGNPKDWLSHDIAYIYVRILFIWNDCVVGFPMNVVAILPYLVYHYFNPPQSCRDAADHIAQVFIHQCYRNILVQKLSQGHMSLVVRKQVFRVSDQVRHKPGCTATEDGYKLEIMDLESRGIVLSV